MQAKPCPHLERAEPWGQRAGQHCSLPAAPGPGWEPRSSTAGKHSLFSLERTLFAVFFMSDISSSSSSFVSGEKEKSKPIQASLFLPGPRGTPCVPARPAHGSDWGKTLLSTESMAESQHLPRETPWRGLRAFASFPGCQDYWLG